MKIDYFKEFSPALNRDMEFKVYGHTGKPCLVFPAKNGRFYDFENFGMIASISDFVESGRVQVFCCDSIDDETWTCVDGNCRNRIELHEKWYHYIVDEFVPRILEINANANGYQRYNKIMSAGCSLGAFHALNIMLRRPDLFDKVLGMSGIYQAAFYFHNYHDELTYMNSPVDYLANLPKDHAYMKLYKDAEIILCCGQGAWEQDCEDSLKKLQKIMDEKGISAWVNFWGYDVSHEWNWWQKQIYYFLQFMV